MGPDELNYQLLARYLAGDCSENEIQKVWDWLEKDPQNQEKFNEFKRIWNLSGGNKKSLRKFYDTETEWGKLKARLTKEVENDHPAKEKNAYEPAFQPTSIHSVGQKVARVAAIFLVAGFIGVFSYQNWYKPEPEPQKPALREVATANGQRANVTLGDGTEVLLNAGSTVKFPQQFEADVREVFLDGEAYFNVQSNPKRPFVIHSRGSLIRVLGTSFSVRSYPEDELVRVVVKEGKVSFEAEDQQSAQKTILTARELGRYHIDSREIEVSRVDDMELYLSWREGYLKFREELMSNVAQELERRYGVEVSFEDPAIKEKLLTAFLKSRSLSNVLDVVAMSLEIEYELEENSVRFFIPKN